MAISDRIKKTLRAASFKPQSAEAPAEEAEVAGIGG